MEITLKQEECHIIDFLDELPEDSQEDAEHFDEDVESAPAVEIETITNSAVEINETDNAQLVPVENAPTSRKKKGKKQNQDRTSSKRSARGEAVVSCEICENKFTNYRNLQLHMRIHSGERPYECSICGAGFLRNAQLALHLDSIHDGAGRHTCEICGATFNAASSFERHMHTHKEKKCRICGKVFAKATKLKRHLIAVHKAVDDLVCKVCGLLFGSAVRCKIHMKTHDNQYRYVCKRCGAGFGTEKKFVEHRLIHITGQDGITSEQNPATSVSSHDTTVEVNSERSDQISIQRLFFCKLCKKKYTSRQGLKNHMMAHFDERPYECSICGVAFVRSSVLSIHLQHVHGGGGKHTCEICGRTFNALVSLEAHMKTHKVKKTAIDTSKTDKVQPSNGKDKKCEEPTYISDKRVKNVSKLICKICEKEFVSQQGLSQHIRVHSEDGSSEHSVDEPSSAQVSRTRAKKRRMCEICDAKFSTPWSLKRHMQSHKIIKKFRVGKKSKAVSSQEEDLEAPGLVHAEEKDSESD